MKIYTRKGDTGETDLFGGGDDGGMKRVPKDGLRIEAIGAVDEVNTWIGMVLAGELSAMDEAGSVSGGVRDDLIEIQKDLFVLGADLATPGKIPVRGNDDVPRVSEESVARLEGIIDRLDSALKPMTAFILPGGCPAAAQLHVARSVCRRAERVCVALAREEDAAGRAVSDIVVKYLNRLSDLLFVMARWENAKQGKDETKWRG